MQGEDTKVCTTMGKHTTILSFWRQLIIPKRQNANTSSPKMQRDDSINARCHSNKCLHVIKNMFMGLLTEPGTQISAVGSMNSSSSSLFPKTRKDVCSSLLSKTRQDVCSSKENKKRKVPKGYIGVYVGVTEDELQRFVIPIKYLNHPLFNNLFESAEFVYGFDQKGGFIIPCDVSEFEYIQWLIAREQDNALH